MTTPSKPRKRKRGRPRRDRYQARVAPVIELIAAWTRNGATIEEICQKIKISPASLYKYRDLHPELEAAITVGRELFDARIENALFKRALGYDCEERVVSSDGQVKITTKHIPGSVEAAKFALTNRCPKIWRNTQEIEQRHTGSIQVVTQMAMPDPIPEVTEVTTE